MKVVLVLAMLVAAAAAASVPFTNCGKTGDHLSGLTVDISPWPPAQGSTITISGSGTTDKAISATAYDVAVKYLGIPLPQIKGDACTLKGSPLACPVAAGKQSVTGVQVAIPADVPHGKYSVHGTVNDQDGQEIACVEIDFELQEKAKTLSSLFAATADAGACANDADKAAFKAHTADFHASMLSCAKGCLGSADCTTKCITPKVGLSAPCGACLGADAGCVKSNCMLKCISPDSASCLACHEEKCEAGLLTCSGLQKGDIPSSFLAGATADAGACANDADKAAFKAHTADFHAKMTSCAKGCLGAGDCAKTCIVKDLSLSDGCAGCFGADVACTKKSCMLKCLNPNSDGCLKCSHDNCFAALKTCAGVDEHDIPSEAAPVLAAPAAPAGSACNNDADKGALAAVGAAIGDKVKKCSLACFGKESCISTCVRDALVISPVCADCFATDATCMIHNCAFACLNASSAGCKKCAASKCDAVFQQCAGVL